MSDGNRGHAREPHVGAEVGERQIEMLIAIADAEERGAWALAAQLRRPAAAPGGGRSDRRVGFALPLGATGAAGLLLRPRGEREAPFEEARQG